MATTIPRVSGAASTEKRESDIDLRISPFSSQTGCWRGPETVPPDLSTTPYPRLAR